MAKRAKRKKGAKRPNRPKQPQQIRHPISKLSLFESMINDMLAHMEEQHETFTEAKAKPHVLDDATVNRAVKAYQNHLDDLQLYNRQLTWWQEDELTDLQRARVDALVAKLPQIRARSEAILAMLAEIREGTIDRILEKDDFELGLEVLLGKHKPPSDRPDKLH